MNQYLLRVAGNKNLDNDKKHCPLPVEIISEKMGISLSRVSAIMWTINNDRLVDLTISFKQGDKDEDFD